MSEQKPLNRAERVLALLTARYPGWVPAIELEAPGGRQAWRTAVSEARQIAKADGGDIVNRTQQMTRHVGGCQSELAWDIPDACNCVPRPWTLSEYRLKTKAECDADRVVVPADAHDLNAPFELR